MRTKRVNGVVWSVGLLVGVAACGAGDTTPAERVEQAEPTGKRTQAIWNGVDDSNDSFSNAVVRLSGPSSGFGDGTHCTGTLLTSTLVLTAAHCTNGDDTTDPKDALHVGADVLVGIGPDDMEIRTDFATQPGPSSLDGGHVVRIVSSRLPGPKPKGADNLDLTIVEIYPPVVGIAVARRPSLDPPALGGSPPDVSVVGWGKDESGSPATIRQRALTAGNHTLQHGNGIWSMVFGGTVYEGVDLGDSGGPLFVGTDPKTRQQIGVLAGYSGPHPGSDSRWADITSFGNDQFIRENAADPSRPGKWKGELDYTLAITTAVNSDGDTVITSTTCDLVNDPDCDGFYNTIPGTSQRGSDNCPDFYNPAQLVDLDANRDGIADGPLVDSDNDGIPDYCDINPGCPTGVDPADADGDGFCDAIDPCPCSGKDVNPWKTDDKDGICAPCDAPAGSVLSAGGTCGQVCNTAVSGIVYDNCVGVKNANQHNDNEDSERVQGAEVLGDECEPVPVPNFQPSYSTQASSVLSTSGNGHWSSVTIQRIYQINGVEAHFRGSVGKPGTPSKGQETPTLVSQTQYRYCFDHSNPGQNPIICSDDANVRDTLLTQPPTRDAESGATAWHRVWMDVTGKPNETFNANPFFGPHMYSSEQAKVLQVWHVADDFAVWQGKDWGQSLGATTASRFWVNSNSSDGTMTPILDHGFHLRQASPEHADQQSNHYEPVALVSASQQTTYQQIPQIKAAFPWTFCASCILERPLPDVDDCPTCTGALPRGPLSDPHEGQLIARLPTGIGLPQSYGILLHDGSFAPIEERLDASTRAALDAPGLVWTGHEEALPHLGIGGSMPSALALSADGTSLATQVALRGHGFATVGLPSTHGPGTAPPVVVGFAAQVAGAPAPGSSPEPRSHFTTIYSRAEGRVFVVGGENPTTHATLETIWWRPVQGTGTWNRVPLAGYTPAAVVAATYSYQDQRLWVLDEVKQGLLKKVRLVRLDPATGNFEQVGAWLKLGVFNQHWLVLDKDGGVLLVASSDLLKQHTVVRFDNQESAWKLDRVVFGQGALAFKPMVDEAGYSFIVNKKPSQPFHDTETKRLADLGGIHAQWSHLGSCW